MRGKLHVCSKFSNLYFSVNSKSRMKLLHYIYGQPYAAITTIELYRLKLYDLVTHRLLIFHCTQMKIKVQKLEDNLFLFHELCRAFMTRHNLCLYKY